jgi:hypothetical protein
MLGLDVLDQEDFNAEDTEFTEKKDVEEKTKIEMRNSKIENREERTASEGRPYNTGPKRGVACKMASCGGHVISRRGGFTLEL